ncbi:TonB-dependent receptor [Arenicella chitinivorans]|uniref:TonB-dependent receptor n=1 Tax=Arenicella chitinivorans TaxID=1329800 RepID=A0A918S3M1_9GAMM|nr:TonB-dependent receptor [Arenicella chitinivorans]GHA19111.1 TonB-dependent receptor [Arenicella chitinivorans]
MNVSKTLTLNAVALSVSGMLLTPAIAQEREAPLEEVIVTGVPQPTSKLESTMSVTAINAEDVTNFAPRSTAEIFRNVPGVQAESSSGDANANIKVRGLPISSGGARYLSLQEDGFPVMLVGDAAFATADSWLRFDTTIGSVQSIRGGSASTQAANAPGGIINFISKTGEQAGGSVGLTLGLDYDSLRLDIENGGDLGGDWTYHIGGFYRSGEGPRAASDDIEEGFQVKATVAKTFDKGSLKFHLKHLDDEVPTYLPIPAQYSGGSTFSELGTNFGDGTLFLNTTDFAPRRDGIAAVQGDGFEAQMTSFALAADYDFNDVLSGAVKYRTASTEGNFASPFPANTFVDGAAGPSVEIVYFDTEVNDVGNDFADVSLSADFGSVIVKAGIALVDQTISTTWNFNQYYRRLDGNLSVFDQGDSIGGVLYGNPAFGNCCTRAYDFEIEGSAPYVSVSGNFGENLSWDASYRKDNYDVTGSFQESTVLVPLDVNGDGVIAANEQAVPTLGAARRADYDTDFDSWSIGVNYALNDNMALFANVSEGGAISSPDRVTGSLRDDGSILSESAYSTVEQTEIGFKYRGDIASFYVTYFDADTEESRQFEVTSQTLRGNTFSASGFELEGDLLFSNGFGVKGSLTLTDSEITSGANAGNTPRRQADYIFNVTPHYSADMWDTGINFVGTDEVFVQDNNSLKFDSYITANLFFNYRFNDKLSVSLNANNLFDEVGFTEGEEGAAFIGDFVRIRPINGRTTSATLRYSF